MNTNALVLSVALFALGLIVVGHAYGQADWVSVEIKERAAAN